MGESLILVLVDNNDVRLLPLSFILTLIASNWLLLFGTVLVIGCATSWEGYPGTCIPSTGSDFWASIFVLECIFTLCCFSGSKICSSSGKKFHTSPVSGIYLHLDLLELKHAPKFKIHLVSLRLSVSCSYLRNMSRNSLVIFKSLIFLQTISGWESSGIS
jgi:hypothetical protein